MTLAYKGHDDFFPDREERLSPGLKNFYEREAAYEEEMERLQDEAEQFLAAINTTIQKREERQRRRRRRHERHRLHIRNIPSDIF